MNWFSNGRFPKRVPLRLSVFANIALIISLSAIDTALAADGPATAASKTSQVDSLEIPGSFKDLPDASNEITAKRSAERIVPVTPANPASPQLVIDAEKLARTDVTAKIARSEKETSTGAKSTRLDTEEYNDADLIDFHATAYCLKGRTASGVNTRPGVIAADPSVLPLGTVVHLRAGRYTGTYTVMDTGGRIKGRLVDVYVETHREAMEFGRRQVKIKVIGRGKPKSDRSKGLLASGL